MQNYYLDGIHYLFKPNMPPMAQILIKLEPLLVKLVE